MFDDERKKAAQGTATDAKKTTTHAPAKAVRLAALAADGDRVLGAAHDAADGLAEQRVHGLGAQARVGVAVPQLPVLAAPPRHDGVAVCWCCCCFVVEFARVIRC